jgi:hypothetical protein
MGVAIIAFGAVPRQRKSPGRGDRGFRTEGGSGHAFHPIYETVQIDGGFAVKAFLIHELTSGKLLGNGPAPQAKEREYNDNDSCVAQRIFATARGEGP